MFIIQVATSDGFSDGEESPFAARADQEGAHAMDGENGALGNERPHRFQRGPLPTSDGVSIREQLMTGALRQGPSFVVLLLILYGLWQMADYLMTEGVTKGIEQIKQGYREIQESHDPPVIHSLCSDHSNGCPPEE